MTDGVLVAADERGAWAWVAVRLDAAADLTETREYADLPEAQRLVKAVATETAFIAGQWEPGTRVELRYLSDPGARRLSAALLGRVQGPSPTEVVTAAQRLRDRLAGVPRHVQASPVTDDAEVSRWLAPFEAHPQGLADIRKRIRTAQPTRPDAGVAWYLAVEPLTAAAPSWEPLWQGLAGQASPVLLAVGLESVSAPAGFDLAMQQLATQYGRLAIPGQSPDGIYSKASQLAPDAFAVDAAALYADAQRRYTARSFRVRISLASPAPLPESLVELVAATISPPQRAADAAALTTTLQGAAYVVVRPEPAEVATARANITTLDGARWDGHYVRALPVAPPVAVRLLAELVDAREASAALRLPLAIHGFMPGFPVRAPGIALEADYRPTGPHLVLGRQLVGGRAGGELGIDIGALTKHALIVGTIGSGKTNSTLSLCQQLWLDHHIPFLVIEPVNTTLDDYRYLATLPGMEELVVLTVGNEGVAPLRLNPFEVPPGVNIGGHIASLLACFDAAFGLWDPLPAIYNRALRETYARRGIVPTDESGPQYEGNWPTLADFVVRMREQTENLDYAGETKSNIIAAARLRAETLAEGACGSTLNCAHSFPIAELLRRPAVIELAGVGDNEKEQSLVTALILQTMTEFYKAGRENGNLAHVTIVEEAHRLLGAVQPGGDAKEGNARARAAQGFANTLSENRKYGEGLVIVDQVPTKLIEDAYKNTNLKLMHRLPAEDDRTVIGSAMKFSDDQQRYGAGLPPFTAFAFHDALDRPALIEVPNVRATTAARLGLERATLADNAELSRRFRGFAQAVPAVDAAIAPFAECEGCQHRCLFRGRAATAVRPSDGTDLRERVKSYPKTAPERREWWRQTIRWTHGIADRVFFPGSDPAERADYEACVFVHAGRLAWRREVLPWVRLYREHSATLPSAGPAVAADDAAAPTP